LALAGVGIGVGDATVRSARRWGGGAVTWQPRVVVQQRDPLRPCEQRLTAAA
jgi:hypothetical protein